MRSIASLTAALFLFAPHLAAQGRVADLDGLTAHRPGHGTETFPFARTAVPGDREEDPLLGPGMRVNGSGEIDPVAEDDLVEVTVRPVVRGASLFLERSDAALALWGTRTKLAGTELSFSANRSAPLAFPGNRPITLWAEATATGSVPLVLDLRTEAGAPLDRLVFHRFRSIVIALGGEGQVPSRPFDPNHGTFLVGRDLYESGYDVFCLDEDGVLPDGSGPVYDEVVNAVQHRGVDEVAIFGYSHGGGSTWSLAARLDAMALMIGPFSVSFTSYVDGVENDSDTDVDMELRRPIGSGLHANHYQVGTLFEDFFLDGGPVPSSIPPPTGLNVETTAWGASATHFTVDDYPQVLSFLRSNLEGVVTR
jgi:hypothetical protein